MSDEQGRATPRPDESVPPEPADTSYTAGDGRAPSDWSAPRSEYTIEPADPMAGAVPEIFTDLSGTTHHHTPPPEAPHPGPHSAPPPAGHAYYYGAPPPRQKSRALRRVVAVLMVLAIFTGLFAIFSMFYEICIGQGNTLISIVRRQSSLVPQEPAPDDGILLIPTSTPTAAMPEVSGAPGGPGAGDGTELILTKLPEGEDGAEPEALSIMDIAERLTPSTVCILASSSSSYGTSTATGTGVIMTESGYIITNNHIIRGASAIEVMMMDGRTYSAVLIGSDQQTDLAVVKIDAQNLPAAPFGDSDELRVGEPVVAIGNPLGTELRGTVTDGIISAINRDVVVGERTMTLIQTNAAINLGNSGGPLINRFGQVIGINTLKMSTDYSSIEGLGFAIPSRIMKPIVDMLIEVGYVQGRPSIGISGQTITKSTASYLGLPTGLMISQISELSDAYRQGLRVRDIIVSADGREVTSGEALTKIKDEYAAGDLFSVTVYRDGQYFDISFRLMDEVELSSAEAIISAA